MLLWCDSVSEGLRRYGFAIPLLSNCNRLLRGALLYPIALAACSTGRGRRHRHRALGGKSPVPRGEPGFFASGGAQVIAHSKTARFDRPFWIIERSVGAT